METQQQSGHAPQAQAKSSGNWLKDVENFFDGLHKKIPFHIPANIKEIIVKVGPWITLVVMLLALPLILAALGLGAAVTPFAMVYGGYHLGFSIMLQGIITLIAFILQGLALPGLFSRSLKGWHLVYYSSLVSAIGQLLGGMIVGMIIGLAISLYVLFEIRGYYK